MDGCFALLTNSTDCHDLPLASLAMTKKITHPLNPPPQGRGRQKKPLPLREGFGVWFSRKGGGENEILRFALVMTFLTRFCDF
ncbi:hypothetical protein [Helicobacter sp. 23-1045]